VTLAGSFGGSATSATWSGGAGSFTPNNTTLTATYTPTAGEISAGTVTLTLTTNDPTGPCPAVSDTVTITINPVATVNAGPDQMICAGSGATLAGSFGGSAASATWSGGAGTFTPNATTLTAVYTPSAGEVSAGTVTLTLTTNDPTGPCGSVTDTVIITIIAGPTANAGPDQTVCASSPAVLLAGSIGGSASNGTWSGGAGSFTPNNTALNAMYTPTAGEIAAGTVILTLTTNNPGGVCGAGSDSMTITIVPLAIVNAGPDQTVCSGSGVTLAGSFGGGASSATWSGGGGTFVPNASSPTATYTPSAGEVTAGTVTLTLTTNDPVGPCTAVSDTVTITINQAATVNAGPDQTICAGLNVILAGSRGGSATTATWSGGSGTFAPNTTTLNATYTPSPAEMTAGFVTLTLTTDDPVGLCPAVSDTVTINLINCTLQYALMVADTSNNRIQGFDGTNWAVIGLGTVGSGNGQFRLPEAVAFSFDGQRIYVADTGNNRIQWSTDAGVTWADFATNGTATNQVKAPQGLAVDSAGNLYVSDTGNGRVMRFNNGVPGFGVIIASNGTASGQVGSPRGLAVDSTFRLFVTDETNSRILRINNANTVVAATSGTVIATAGTGMNKVQNPQGITIDSSGTIFVADTGNSRILRWVNANPANASTMALTGSQLGQVNRPEGVTVVQFTSGPFSGGPFLVVGDTSNNRIQGRFIPTGQWSLVGSPNNIGSGVGQFRAPSKIQ
ncbi:MAG TPA: SMP-30/gluconolactonase/LRE family protein, partial [Acidobacteriota bacterium]|nr:SMP-30/gluconolactonase/LRE family protein [Acidobacteriota bacterium]